MGSVVASAPTVGSNHEIYEYKGVRFGLIDIGGQTSLRSSWSEYFAGTQAIILVIDSSDSARLSLAKAELQKLIQAEVSPNYSFYSPNSVSDPIYPLPLRDFFMWPLLSSSQVAF
jgi:GTPase SAR1 family protein